MLDSELRVVKVSKLKFQLQGEFLMMSSAVNLKKRVMINCTTNVEAPPTHPSPQSDTILFTKLVNKKCLKLHKSCLGFFFSVFI